VFKNSLQPFSSYKKQFIGSKKTKIFRFKEGIFSLKERKTGKNAPFSSQKTAKTQEKFACFFLLAPLFFF